MATDGNPSDILCDFNRPNGGVSNTTNRVQEKQRIVDDVATIYDSKYFMQNFSI